MLPRTLCASRRPVTALLLVGTLAGVALAAEPISPELERPTAESHAGALDAQDLLRLQRVNPQGYETLQRAEAARLHGSLEAALPAFELARTAAPESAVAARRYCEVLLELQRLTEARDVCTEAVRHRASGAEVLALTRALLPPAELPEPENVEQALTLIVRAESLAQRDFLARVARCYLAERLGDMSMLENCAAQLSLLAPADTQTKHYQLSVRSWQRRQNFWSLLGLLSLGAAGTLTLGHAMLARRWSVARAKRLRHVASAGVCLALLGSVPIARAEAPAPAPGRVDANVAPPGSMPGTKWTINDADPEASVPSQDEANRFPIEFSYLLMDLAAKADRAEKVGAHAAAARYYRAMAKAVPDSAVGPAKACAAYERSGQREEALAQCRLAAGLNGVTATDLLRLVQLQLAKEDALSALEVADVTETLKHLKAQTTSQAAPQLTLAVELLDCELALRQGAWELVEACVSRLVARAPDNPRTLSFQWALAMKHDDFAAAKRLVARAEQLQLPAEAIAKMQSGIALAETPAWRRAWLGYRRVFAGVALTLLCAAVFWFGRRRPTQLLAAGERT